MNRRWIVFIILVVVLASCSLPIGTTKTPQPTPVTATATQVEPTPTLVPIETLLALPTATFLPTVVFTPRQVLASPLDHPVNCRYGPSTAYAVVGGLDLGKQAEVVGKNVDATWWYVRNPYDPSKFCWLIANLIETFGNTDALPVVAAPPAQVTDIRLSTAPPSLNVSCEDFPQYVTVSADIVTNGPTTVMFRWETSEGEMIDADELLYLEAGTKNVFVYYKLNVAKDYWIQVHVFSPNDTGNRTTFKATCTP